jgi:molybdate transport system ATP-binding protein
LRLLILDEPFTGLDAASRMFLTGALEHLMRTRLRVLFVTARPEDLPEGITHCLSVHDCQVTGGGRRRRGRTPKESRSNPNRGSRKKVLCSSTAANHPIRKTGPILVELRNVSVRYGSATILDQVTWTIRSGESWALLGPNGAGKTTLLSLVLGDNPQTHANDVTVFGKRRGQGESIWEIKRQIGWVSPELHLHFDDSMTCLEAVLSGFHDTIGLFEAAKPGEQRAARDWLRRFGLQTFEHAPLFTLSLGLQRMVLLARALVKQPKLLVLDEPCQGLDAVHRDRFLISLDPLLASGQETAIYVTHRAEEIPRSVRRVLRLNRGKVSL